LRATGPFGAAAACGFVRAGFFATGLAFFATAFATFFDLRIAGFFAPRLGAALFARFADAFAAVRAGRCLAAGFAVLRFPTLLLRGVAMALPPIVSWPKLRPDSGRGDLPPVKR
jgi:hypothetical protein